VLGLAVTTAELGAQARVAEPAVVDVVGTVVDDAGRPLAGAFVSLDGSDRGVLSDERGRFRIPDLDAGRVVLRVEQLGYADLVWAGVVGTDPRPLVLALEPRPVMLEGLTVVTDRFRARRNAVATAVRAWERADLATSPYETAARFIAARAGLATVPCRAAHSSLCVWSRGRVVSPTVYVDEAPIFGGMEYLDALPPHELHLVEVYGNGRHIRAYTEQFMERAAQIRLQPVAFLR
jgi:hypothetical protein